MELAAQLILNGLALGCVYALVALGMVLVYEATGIVNFATGQLVMVGTFVAATAVSRTGLPVVPAYLAALVAMAGLGLLFWLIVHRPLAARPVVTVIIGTVAVGIVVQNVAAQVWGPLPIRVASPIGTEVLRIGGLRLALHPLLVVGCTIALVGLLWWVLFRTPVGARLRAVAQDEEAARLMGIRVSRAHAVTWAAASVLAGAAGVLLGPIWLPDVNMGDSIALKAFAAAIIGGFGSVQGAIVGGVTVGLLEVLGAYFVSSTYKELIVFGAMFAVLLVVPRGLFGERVGERG